MSIPSEIAPADCEHCCPAGWSPNIDQFPDEDCPVHGRNTHAPGLDHLLEEVAVEVLRQDAASDDVMSPGWSRIACVRGAARSIRSVRAIDQAVGGEQP